LIEIQLTFCGPQKIRTLNHKFRGEDRVTDVLSFPLQAPLAWRKKVYTLPILPWGDVVICLAQAAQQAREHQRTLEQEVLYLFIHSWLHLYGLDHQTPAQTKKMFWQQDQLYARILKAAGSPE
jgi:probable rRNA maturation factor